MSHNFQVGSSDESVPDENYPGQHKTQDSGYYSLATPTARSPYSDLNDISERNDRGDGSFPEPIYPGQKRHETPRALNLTVPPLGRVNALDDGFLYDNLGQQSLDDMFLWTSLTGPTPSPSRQNFSLPNQLQSLDTTAAVIHDLSSTEIVSHEPSLDNGSAGSGSRLPKSTAKDTAKEKGEVAGLVPSDSERTTATAFVNTWLTQFPGKWPSPEIIAALATSSELGSEIIENAFSEILHSNAIERSQAQPQPRSKEPSRSLLEAASHYDSWDETECLVLEKASAWVTKHKKKCLPLKKNTFTPQSEYSLRIYKCTLGCGWTFDRKDSWKEHEERVHPQEGWICNLDATVSISGTTRCSYCGIPDPAIDHLEEVHSKLQISGSCRQKPFGRGKVFFQKEHLVSHFKNIHKDIPYAKFLSLYHFVVQPDFERVCSLCSSYDFRDWPDRIAHLAADHFEKDAKVNPKGSQAPGTSSATDSTNKTTGSQCNAVRTSMAPGLNVTHLQEQERPVSSLLKRKFARASPDIECSSTARLDAGNKHGQQPSTSTAPLAAAVSVLTSAKVEELGTRQHNDGAYSNASMKFATSTISCAIMADTATSKIHHGSKQPSPKRLRPGSMNQDCDSTCPPQTELSSDDSHSDTVSDLIVFHADVPHWTDSFTRGKTAKVINTTEDLDTRQQLLESRMLGDRGQFFIPIDSIYKTVTKEMVAHELRAQPNWKYKVGEDEVGEVVRVRALKLFGTLTIIRKPVAILDFLAEKIDDRDLPLQSSRLAQLTQKSIVGIPDPNSWHQQGAPQSAEKWTSWDVEEFCRVQWWFLSPVFTFKSAGQINYYELDDSCVLPFIESDERTGKAVGGFGDVWRVKIHPAHQKLDCDEGRKAQSYPSLAIKRLVSRNKDEFKRESAMLSALNKYSHKHVITLLATYRFQDRYHLMFPLAKTDLRSYWKNTPVPPFNLETVSWFLEQITGIASALRLIHGSTREAPTGNIPDEPLKLGMQTTKKAELYGRHGDIKAENILWFQQNDAENSFGILQIADFGLGRFHRQDSRSRVSPDSIGCSPTYAPPELALGKPVSRAFDIWSLGCLYLEFITWLLMGREALEAFADAREYFDPDTGTCDDIFFTCHPSRPSHLGAVIKDGVLRWIQHLHETPRSSVAIHDLLDLIHDRVLVVEQARRTSAEKLTEDLNEILERGKVNASYILTPVPQSSVRDARFKRALSQDLFDTLLEG